MKIVSLLAVVPVADAVATQTSSAGALLQAASARNVTEMAGLLQNLAEESIEGDGIEQLEPTIKQALYVIRGNLVKSIRDSLVREHKVDQDDIMQKLECFTQCKIDKRKGEGNCGKYVDEAKELNIQHTSCRNTLMSNYVSKIEDCNALDDWVKNFKLDPKVKEFCVYDPAYMCHSKECPESSPCKPSIDDKFGGWLRDIITAANSGLNTWKELHKQCKASYHTYIKQDAVCDVKQSQFEMKKCGEAQCKDMVCNDQYSACRARCEASYHATNKRVECAEKDRKIDWSATEKIECFLRILLASPTDEDVQKHCEDKTKCLSTWRTTEFNKCNTVCEEVDYDSGSYSQHARRESKDGEGLDYNTFWHESQQPLRQHADMAVYGDATFGVNTTHRVSDKADVSLEKRCTQHLDIDFQPIPVCEPCVPDTPMPCDEVFTTLHYQQFTKTTGVAGLSDYRKCHTELPGEHTEKWAYNLCECQKCKRNDDFCPRPSTCSDVIRGQDYLGGGDYKQVHVSSAEACQAVCTEEEKCASFAYTKSNKRCYLKTGVPDLKSAGHVDSGLPCGKYVFPPITHVVPVEEE